MKWEKVRKLYLFNLCIVVACFFITGCGPSTKSNTYVKPKPIDAPEGKVSFKNTSEYKKLLRDRDNHEKWLDNLEKQRYALDYKRTQPMVKFHGVAKGAGASGMVNAEGMSNDPLGDLKRDQWQYESVIHQINVLTNDLNKINNKIHSLNTESYKSCFPKDTKILTSENKFKKISDIKIGDEVLVYDIANDNVSKSIVKEKYVDENNHVYKVNNSIEATAYERFLTKKGWKKISELKKGDLIFNGNSFEKVFNVLKMEKDLIVYNLHIESSHNFFVSKDGESSYLVHNTGGGSGGSGGGK